MSNSPFEGKKFLELRKKWYKKLKADGFEDIEYHDWGDGGKSGNLLAGFGHMDAVRYYSQDEADYYYRCGQYLQHLLNKANLLNVRREPQEVRDQYWTDYRVWKLHSDGLSATRIARELKMGIKTVRKIVDRIGTAMRENPEMTGEQEKDDPRSALEESGETKVTWTKPTRTITYDE